MKKPPALTGGPSGLTCLPLPCGKGVVASPPIWLSGVGKPRVVLAGTIFLAFAAQFPRAPQVSQNAFFHVAFRAQMRVHLGLDALDLISFARCVDRRVFGIFGADQIVT